ncbi:MAG: hypothetical protein ACI84R_001428 [Candidatus Azotimanducaceae bacterium]|jgi:hypothetical protein
MPIPASADHVPDNLVQELDPNYIVCMMAVDDAEVEFLNALQFTCIQRMGDICGGRNGIAPPSQVVDCIHFETQRGIAFMRAGVTALPDVIEKKGFFGHGYKRRRDGILRDMDTLKNLPKPLTVEIAKQQAVSMASAVHMLFWLARKTEASLEAHVLGTIRDH